MKNQLHTLLIVLFLSIPFFSYSTHIVGGSLNYVYNGGSNYTVTLKLYRDCSPGTFTLPATVLITVLGYNGVPFTPSRDITIPLGTVTPVPANLPPCASAPNPMPCTQEAIYTTTVNNLPPNPGGYHMYYQLEARNLTITNVNTSGNNVAESFYAHIPGPSMYWNEDFALANGTTVDNGTTAWSIAAGTPAPASASVNANAFQITGADNAQETWTSQVINISAFTTGVNLRADLFETGTLEANDSILVYYRLNGGPLVPFSTNSLIANDFTSAVATQSTLIGNTVQIIIRVHYDALSPNTEVYRFDNVLVYGNDFIPNSNSVFNQFPPLFLCHNIPFTFNHGATDAEGDSLVYSFYTPYNGDNNVGPLDPTFSGNVAIFTPVIWQPGFSATNPLGGSPLNLNSSTGLLSGTPPMLGQFVVGIVVKEYRNGVYLSQTLRDCQFNVITCPQNLAVTIAPQNPTVCFGGTSTTITANGSGGTPAYTYLWNGINPSQTINVGPGTYSVMLTDASGCHVYSSITVTSYSLAITANAGKDDTICTQGGAPVAVLNGTVTGATGGIWSGGAGTFNPNNTTVSGVFYTPTAAEIANGCVNLTLTTTGNGTCPAASDVVRVCFMGFTGTVSATTVNVSCYGANNGTATATVTGGVPPYSYFWNPGGQTTATASNLGPGTYSVTIQNGIGCSYTTSVVITQPPPLGVNPTVTNLSCFGGTNGTITTTVTGGTPAYTYLWSPGGQTTASVSNLSAGTYTFTVRDSKNCVLTSVYTITQPPQLAITLSPTNVSCFSGNNGSVNTTVTGGTPSYTYNWNPTSATSPNLSGLTAGNYSLTVSDSKGCTRTATVSITQPTVLTVTVSKTNKTCSNLNNGTATASVSGGTLAYTYSWLPGGQTTPSISNLSAGTYTLTVRDLRGCTVISIITITSPPVLAINFINQSNVACFGGNTGSVTANVTGGTPAYTYLWSPGGQTTANAGNLSVGTYTLTVNDNNGCQVQSTVVITQPSLALSVTPSFTPVSCPGGSDGTLSSSVVGGTLPYTYNWQPGSYTTQNVSNIIAGTYSITVTDANGCTDIKTTTVTEPPLITLTTSTIPADCNASNGQATVVVAGGVMPYTYQWVPTGGNTNMATGLSSGTYTVLVNDANGCSAFELATISSNAGPTAAIVSTTSVTCYGGANGSAIASVTGGTNPYTYSWSTSPVQNTLTATGLTAGTYVFTVTDGTGCQSLATTNLIPQPTQIMVSVTTANSNCFGGSGSASVSASGGTPGYTYTWLPSGNTGPTISGLTANTYTVQVMDANNCVRTSVFVINQPTQLASSISASTNVSCYGGNDGTATVNVSGGTPFYTYNWLPYGGNGPTAPGLSAGTYTVNIVDSKGCPRSSTVAITQPSQALTVSGTAVSVSCFGGANGLLTANPVGGTPGYTYQWSPTGGTSQTASGLSVGQYFVLVTDAKGCQANTTLNISQPSAINGTLAITHPSCGFSNGVISSQISGGTIPYSYLWTPGLSPSSSISAVGAGNYTLQVTDAMGCKENFTATLTNIPGPVSAVSSVSNVSCFGGNNGTATVNITSGTLPYSINWLPYGGNNSSAGSLTSGTYTVNVTDALGCKATSTVTVTQPTPVAISIYTVTPVSCYGGSNGGIIVTVSGGTPSYVYSWNNGQTTGVATNLSAGTYTLNVLDQKGCSTSISVNITQPTAPLTSSLSSVVNASCFAGFGSASITATGGTIMYTYSWSTNPVQTTSTVTNLTAGVYTVTVRDAKGCTSVRNVTISQPTKVITTAGPNDTICSIPSPVTLTATASGGTGTYYYQWLSSGIVNSGTLNISPLSSITYTVIAYDQNGCAGTPDSVSAIVYSLLPGNVKVTTLTPICKGQTSYVYAQTTGSAGPFTYQWNNGLPSTQGAHIVMPSQPTTYIVTVTNQCNVSVTDSVRITFNPPPTLLITSDTNVSCAPATIQFVDNSVSGNVNDPITSWYWTFGDGSSSTLSDPTHIFVQPGTYLVNLTVTTEGGCSANNVSAPLIVNVVPSPLANFTTSPSVTPMSTQTINFINQSSGANSYLWNFGDGGTSTAANPQHYFPTMGFYTVSLITTNNYGCRDTFLIRTSGEGGIVVPNAFIPGTNTNNIFFPFASGLEEFNMKIFNRWGELIFETSDIKIGWDGYYRGELCQQDVYVWMVSGKFIDGKTFTQAGDVTLLR